MSLTLKREVVAKVAAEAERAGKSMSRTAEEMLDSAEPHVLVEEVRCGCGAVVGQKRTAFEHVDRLRMMHAKDHAKNDEALKADFRCRDCGATVRQ
jgi:rubrerythrin